MHSRMKVGRVRNIQTQTEDPAQVEERGATLVEYAMLFSLIIGTTLLAIQTLTDSSGDYLSTTGDDIGQPRDRIADMDPDLPDPPAWIP